MNQFGKRAETSLIDHQSRLGHVSRGSRPIGLEKVTSYMLSPISSTPRQLKLKQFKMIKGNLYFLQ